MKKKSWEPVNLHCDARISVTPRSLHCYQFWAYWRPNSPCHSLPVGRGSAALWKAGSGVSLADVVWCPSPREQLLQLQDRCYCHYFHFLLPPHSSSLPNPAPPPLTKMILIDPHHAHYRHPALSWQQYSGTGRDHFLLLQVQLLGQPLHSDLYFDLYSGQLEDWQ